MNPYFKQNSAAYLTYTKMSHKLSGSQYRKAAKEKVARNNELLAKTPKLSSWLRPKESEYPDTASTSLERSREDPIDDSDATLIYTRGSIFLYLTANAL